MSRSVSGPTGRVVSTRILPVKNGGTAGGTPEEALEGLRAISQDLEDVSGGVAVLTAASLTQDKNIPTHFESGVTVKGPTSVEINTTTTHTITNYDVATKYVVKPILGVVKIEKDVITYWSGSKVGLGGFVINGKAYGVSVLDAMIPTPSILTPTTGAVDQPGVVRLSATGYKASIGAGQHVSTTWQICSDADCTQVVFQSVDDTVNLTEWNTPQLSTGTMYYARCRYTGINTIMSGWSDVISFKTRDTFGAYITQAVFMAPEPAVGESFGISVCVSDDATTAVMGASGLAGNTGAVYIYTHEGESWRLIQKLQAPTPKAGDYYGCSLAFSKDGTRLAVGAYGYNSYVGAVFIYTKVNHAWVLESTLVPTDAPVAGWFGTAVALSGVGDRLMVSCYGRGDHKGAVYSFVRNMNAIWTNDQIITAATQVTDDVFGISIAFAMDGQTLVVGAPQNVLGGIAADKTGYVNVYRYTTTYGLVATLKPSDNFVGGMYGMAVSCSPDAKYIAVGARNNVNGKVYVYHNVSADYSGTWGEITTLLAPGGVTAFGATVDMSDGGTHIVVGAPMNAGQEPSVFVYDQVEGVVSLKHQLILDEANTSTELGGYISLSQFGDYMLVGARGYSDYTGAAVMYH